jgi:hypothetical protein
MARFRSRSSPGSRLPAPVRAARTMNTDWTKIPYFAALDWASDHHDVIVLDRHGAVRVEFWLAHTAAGWAEFTARMPPFTGVPLTLETSSGSKTFRGSSRNYRNRFPM